MFERHQQNPGKGGKTKRIQRWKLKAETRCCSLLALSEAYNEISGTINQTRKKIKKIIALNASDYPGELHQLLLPVKV